MNAGMANPEPGPSRGMLISTASISENSSQIILKLYVCKPFFLSMME